jgi:hypothetical protein
VALDGERRRHLNGGKIRKKQTFRDNSAPSTGDPLDATD